MRRTVRCILVAMAPLICAVIAPVLFKFSDLYAQVYLDRRFPALSRYALERTPGVALVGSSMTFRIYERYFKTPLRNISISGGSPLTGLAVLASYPTLPHVVLVETNIMSRPIDPEAVDDFGNDSLRPFPWFRPYRVAISFVYYWLKYEREDVTRLLASAPGTYDISSSVAEISGEYARPNLDEAMAENTQTMKRLVSAIQSRGSKVYFYELPYPGKLGESHFAVTARTLMHEAFPDTKQWLKFDDHLPELRWVDANHMDERSAAIVAHEMDGFLETLQ
jgi:hypothetical protein